MAEQTEHSRDADQADTLLRFVEAQEPVLADVMAELARGRKQSHWMWFVFPQLIGLGRSGTARRFGIADADEARAYIAHPVLGPRLRAASELMLSHAGIPAEQILGSVDALKLRSCATLFAAVSDAPVFPAMLAAFHDGAGCPHTRAILA